MTVTSNELPLVYYQVEANAGNGWFPWSGIVWDYHKGPYCLWTLEEARKIIEMTPSKSHHGDLSQHRIVQITKTIAE